jgi:hypothetical protein
MEFPWIEQFLEKSGSFGWRLESTYVADPFCEKLCTNSYYKQLALERLSADPTITPRRWFRILSILTKICHTKVHNSAAQSILILLPRPKAIKMVAHMAQVSHAQTARWSH